MAKSRLRRAVSGLKRGFKTLAVKRKGRVAGKLAKQLKETRGVKIRNLKAQRAGRKLRARRLLGVQKIGKR